MKRSDNYTWITQGRTNQSGSDGTDWFRQGLLGNVCVSVKELDGHAERNHEEK